MASSFEKAGIIIHKVELLIAVRGGGDPEDWDWDELVGDPPLTDEDAGTRVLQARSEEQREDSLTPSQRASIAEAADLPLPGASS